LGRVHARHSAGGPVITGLDPASVEPGSDAFTLTVNGAGFDETAVVTFDGNERATTFVNSGQLTVAILAADVTDAGSYPVQVEGAFGDSNVATFAVAASGDPFWDDVILLMGFEDQEAGAHAATDESQQENTMVFGEAGSDAD